MKYAYLILAMGMLSLYGCSSTEDTVTPTKNTNAASSEEEEKEEQEEVFDGHNFHVQFIPHYILGFYQVEKLLCYYSAKDSHIVVSFPNSLSYSWEDTKNPNRSEAARTYITLCKRYNDLTYTEGRRMISANLSTCHFLADNIVAINVICGTDYDAEHPAGTSLNDICMLVSGSPRRYIASGYTEKYDWSTTPTYVDEHSIECFSQDGRRTPICKLLSECTPEDMVLMGSGATLLCKLIFTKPPTNNAERHFIVTMTNERGRIYSTANRDLK